MIDARSICHQIQDSAIIFDLHAHPSLKLSIMRRIFTLNQKAAPRFDPFSMRTDFSKLRAGGISALNSVIYAPEKGLLDDCGLLRLLRFSLPIYKEIASQQYFNLTLKMLDEIEKMVNEAIDPETGEPFAKMAHTVLELNEILSLGGKGPIAYVHCVEGAHSIELDLQKLGTLFERGVAYLTLAHFYDNGVAPPVFPFPETMQKLGCFGGRRDLTKDLSELGVKVVERMIELGMLIDVTHCTPTARKHIYDVVGDRAPLLATHVGTAEINPSPYNLQDWEVRTIAETGGIIGVIFMNYWLAPYHRLRGLDFVSQTLQHFRQLAGEDHVGFGSDFDGFTDPPDDLKDASEMKFLIQRLVVDGYSRTQIEKLLGLNAWRVLRDGWGKTG
jgi:microsomal dipeptidase-like Zn-dependent dipeptidase